MKFFVLSGSHRPEAQSLKVARYVEAVLKREHAGAEVHLYSLSGNPLPLWDDAHGGAPDALWDPISAELRAAAALVVVTPEWGGMATPGVKNFLLNCTADEIGHKPGLIVTVSASRGGSYPVAELRMSGYKNNRLVWIPEHVIVQHAEQNFNAPDGAGLAKEDATIRTRLRYALRLLEEYAKALALVRASGVIDHRTFRSGM
ncbi:MAG TPA: NAD(P)H-dependent oxidoreductase [Lacunisphaera sp.]|nr:NAD(P)H-dependent oxidoreductase [Lacunisphaera sp.]